MSTINQKLATNSVAQIAGKIISAALGLIAIAAMTRYLGREGFGNYATITSFLQFFGIIADAGLTVIALKMIAERPKETDRLLSNIFTLRLVTATVFLGLAPLIVLFFPFPIVIKLGIALTTLSLFFITLNQILVAIFQRELRTDQPALAEVLGRVVLVIGVIMAVWLDLGLFAVLWAMILSSLATFIINYLFSLKYVKITLVYDAKLWLEIAKASWPIGLSIIFNLIYLKADTIILSLMRSQEEVGLYNAPYRVLEVLMQFPYMFIGLILPLLMAHWQKKELSDYRKIFTVAFDVLSLLAWPLVIGTYFTAEKIMVFVAGQEFASSGQYLRVLMLAIVIMFWGVLSGHAVVAIDKQRALIAGYLATAVVAVTGYLILIPLYGALGAAWMTVISETMITVITFGVVLYVTRLWPSFKVTFKAAASSLVMGLVLWRLPNANLFTMISLAGITYAVVLYILKGYSLKTVRELVRLQKVD